MKIGVIGGGIIGVTTALCLKENVACDVDVTVVTEKTSPETTGDGAAGIWGLYLVQATPEQKRSEI
jgi:glycine/D-amino acid oxidase-like deaminating enzyme